MAPLRSGLSLLVALAVPLAGCSSLDVMTDWDSEVQFDRLQTYRWAPTKKPDDQMTRATQGLMDKRIRRAVDYELDHKGFVRTEGSDADLLVVYRATTKDRVDVYQHRYRPAYGANVYRYREGTLMILFVDPADDSIVWQGWATDVVRGPDKAEAQINHAVRAILHRFPPS